MIVKKDFLTIVLKDLRGEGSLRFVYRLLPTKVASKWKNLVKFTLSDESSVAVEKAPLPTKNSSFFGLQFNFRPVHKMALKAEDFSQSVDPHVFGALYLLRSSEGLFSQTVVLSFCEGTSFRREDLVLIGEWVGGDSLDTSAEGREELQKKLESFESQADFFIEKVPDFNKRTFVLSTLTDSAPNFRLRELDYHLDFIPYIDLGIEFEHGACLAEAMKLLDRFVEHRPQDQTSQGEGKWKSLALRAIDGDPSNTQYVDMRKGIDFYEFTPISKLCPKTMEFLGEIADLDRCERIRFMLLEPGARINVHSDSLDRPVSTAVNIALNMPEGCNFYLDTNSTGTSHSYTSRVPFKAGSVMLLNVAKYHYVENNSNIPRIHIILHGPLRLSEEEVLKLARRQNGLQDSQKLLTKLIRKTADLSIPVDASSRAFKEWKTRGLTCETLPSTTMILVVESSRVSTQLRAECLRITKASLFPIKSLTIVDTALDDWLLQNRDQNDLETVVIVAAGTFIGDNALFFVELLRAIADMRKSNAMLCGHIMHRIQNSTDGPYLHEQFAILDFKKFTALSAVGFGQVFGENLVDFPSYEVSVECVHDDYTPLWLKGGSQVRSKKIKSGWGTELISLSIQHGLNVINIPTEIRKLKLYSYPDAPEVVELKRVRSVVQSVLAQSEKTVFFFNNESLKVTAVPGFVPDCFISVAAGMKPAQIVAQYWGRRSIERAVFIDFSENSLAYMRGLISQPNEEDMISFIADFMLKCRLGTVKTRTFVQGLLKSELNDYFENDFYKLREPMEQLSQAEFIKGDFLQNHDLILEQLISGKRTLFWHSNSWSYRPIFYSWTKEDLEKNYLELGRKISQKQKLKGWKHKSSYQMLFGEEFENPMIFLSDGSNQDGTGTRSDYFQCF